MKIATSTNCFSSLARMDNVVVCYRDRKMRFSQFFSNCHRSFTKLLKQQVKLVCTQRRFHFIYLRCPFSLLAKARGKKAKSQDESHFHLLQGGRTQFLSFPLYFFTDSIFVSNFL